MMPTISVKLDEGLLAQVDLLSQKKQLSRSECIRQALKTYITGDQFQYERLPPELKEKIDFLFMLTLNGSPHKDWELIQKEVESLWTNMQSSNSLITAPPPLAEPSDCPST